jgi:hypothetical protein
MTTTEVFLVAMVVIFTVPYLLRRLGRTDYWAPGGGSAASPSAESGSAAP